MAEGRPTESGGPAPRQTRFDARDKPNEVVAKQDILAGISEPLIDARGKARFEGTEADPRALHEGCHWRTVANTSGFASTAPAN